MKIRRARWWELREIGKMYADAYESYGYDWDDRQAIKQVEKFYHIQKDLFFIVDDREVGIIGGVWGAVMHHSSGEYLNGIEIWVDPEYQRRGVGKQMLRHLIEQALRKYKIRFIEFHADSEKGFPYNYYKKLGFEESAWTNLSGDPEEILKKLK